MRFQIKTVVFKTNVVRWENNTSNPKTVLVALWNVISRCSLRNRRRLNTHTVIKYVHILNCCYHHSYLCFRFCVFTRAHMWPAAHTVHTVVNYVVLIQTRDTTLAYKISCYVTRGTHTRNVQKLSSRGTHTHAWFVVSPWFTCSIHSSVKNFAAGAGDSERSL